jgi:hypothetical protein
MAVLHGRPIDPDQGRCLPLAHLVAHLKVSDGLAPGGRRHFDSRSFSAALSSIAPTESPSVWHTRLPRPSAAWPRSAPCRPTSPSRHRTWCCQTNANEGAVRRMRTSLRCPSPTCRSGSEKAAPLGKSGGAGLLVGIAILEVALRWKVVVDRGMDRGELLQRSHATEPQHRSRRRNGRCEFSPCC